MFKTIDKIRLAGAIYDERIETAGDDFTPNQRGIMIHIFQAMEDETIENLSNMFVASTYHFCYVKPDNIKILFANQGETQLELKKAEFNFKTVQYI